VRPECASAAAVYRLVLPLSPLSGRAGERLGRATGSSLEFMDFRDYAPGDDLRHVDWRTFARTDQLKVRLYREEVAPVLEIIVDTSASMAVTPEKERALRDLVDAFCEWARRAAGTPRLLAAGGDVIEGTWTLDGSADAMPRVPLRPRTLRMWISDFLFRDDPAPTVKRLAHGAAHVYLVQLLDPWELDPDTDGARTLLDCEEDTHLDLVLDRPAVARYRERLQRLRTAVQSSARAVGGSYACVTADAPARMFREGLMPQGIVEPA